MRRIVLIFGLIMVTVISHGQLRIGGAVPEISLPGMQDSTISLSSLKGKIILIDFWASWCAPCRAANPFIEKLYNKYKDQGFEVFAVSLDVKQESWLKAVKKDKLTYTQVIDLAGWNSKVAESFYVDALPTNFLLDRDGKIVAINIEGKEMFDKVKELVK